jgi:hypothetical protein
MTGAFEMQINLANSLLRIVLLIAAIHGVSSNAFAQSDEKQIEELRIRIENSREKLVSGKVQGNGTFISEYESKPDKRDFRFLMMFDFVSGDYFIDMIDGVPVGRGDKMPYRGIDEFHSLAARSDDKVMAYSNADGKSILWLDHRHAELPRQLPVQVTFFDPRVCGIEIGPYKLPVRSLSEILDIVFSPSETQNKVFDQGNGTVLLEQIVAGGIRFRRLWINKELEYVVEKCETGFRFPSDEPGGLASETVTGVSQVEWKMVNGAIVPVKFSSEWPKRVTATSKQLEEGLPPQLEIRESVAVELNWLLINKLPEGINLDYHAFGLPKGTMVYDKRFNPTKMVELIQFESVSPSQRLNFSPSATWLWWCAAFVLLFFAGIYGVFRRKSFSTP